MVHNLQYAVIVFATILAFCTDQASGQTTPPLAATEKEGLSIVIRDVVFNRKLESANLIVEITELSRPRKITLSSQEVSPPSLYDAARQKFQLYDSYPKVCPYGYNTFHCQYLKTTTDETLLFDLKFGAPNVYTNGSGHTTFSIYWVRPNETESVFTITVGPFPIKDAADLR